MRAMHETTSTKQRLLDAALTHVASEGVSELSLRQLASALGTSHRMLLYHFGSKEGLLVEVVRTVEERQRRAFAGLEPGPGESPADVARRFWRTLSDPELWPQERLFFELYGQALQGRPGARALLDGVVEAWLAPLTELMRRNGAPADSARADARLGLAVVRGLLLDLLATEDRRGVDLAMERFITAYAATPPENPGS
jgi:AcrR family transcriptional regulator